MDRSRTNDWGKADSYGVSSWQLILMSIRTASHRYGTPPSGCYREISIMSSCKAVELDLIIYNIVKGAIHDKPNATQQDHKRN